MPAIHRLNSIYHLEYRSLSGLNSAVLAIELGSRGQHQRCVKTIRSDLLVFVALVALCTDRAIAKGEMSVGGINN
jgi:hypothetical protein